MHDFPCVPDCPLEIWADWLEDHNIDPVEVRSLASGWCFFGSGLVYSFSSWENNFGIGWIYGNGANEVIGAGFNSGDGIGYFYSRGF